MTKPVVVLRCALANVPLGTVSTWTDMSSRLLGFTTSRGRESETDDFQTGQATWTLKDDDRQLDPANTAGTQYGNLTPRKRWQLTAVWSGATYTLFDAHNRNWKPEWNSKHARHGIQATDAFDIFNENVVTNGTFTTQVTDSGSTQVRAPRAAEPTGTRIGWLADQTGWPASRRDIDTGVVNAGAYAYEGANALTSIRDITDAELGFCFMGTTGNLTFRDKYDRVGGTVQAVFDYATGAGAAGELHYVDWDYNPQDVDHIVNHATGKVANQTVDNPTVHEYTDSASITANGPAANTFDLWTDSDAEAEARTQFLVGRYAQPAIRVKTITIKPAADPTNLWPKALGLAIGDRIRVRQRFYGTGSTLTTDCYVEGVRHDAGPGDWQTTLNLSPVVSGIDNQTYWNLGTSTLGTSVPNTTLAF